MRSVRRIHVLVVGSAAVVVAAIVVLSHTSVGFATESTIGVSREHAYATSVAPPPKKKHKGERAKGNWHSCDDNNATIRKVTMPATLSGDSVTWSPTTHQLEQLYSAALDECFMQDLDSLPEYGRFAPQHDGRDYVFGDEIVTLFLRPASDVAQTKMGPTTGPGGKPNKDEIGPGEGFIAADIHNTSNTQTFYTDNFPGEIKPQSSALFWIGKDNAGTPYAAFVDIGNIPFKTGPDRKDDFKIMHSGGLTTYPKPRTDIGIARWHHEHDDKNHAGSWVDCDPGCCMSNAEAVLFSTDAKRTRPFKKVQRPVSIPKSRKKP
ncbi:MAG: hypothetical protein JWM95_1619 [Gemmatimonadetes bacterium]|nr:hypothetical protein [Gemmatimonadota bacterium]